MSRNSFKIDKSVSLAPQAAAPTVDVSNGDMYYDSVLSTFRGRAGGNWVSLYSPFTILSPGVPSNPPVDILYVYKKTGDDNIYKRNSSGVESIVGAGLASSVATTVSGFNHLLSGTDTTVQIALDTIDDNAMIKSTSSLDRQIVLFSGTLGQATQNSLTIIDANGTILVPTTQGLDTATSGALYIGATNGIVTIGRAGQTVTVLGGLDVQGTLSYIHTTDLTVSDSVVTLNKGGVTTVSGLEIEGNPSGQDIVGKILFDNSLTSKWKSGDKTTQYELLTAGTSTINSHAQTFYSKTVGDTLAYTITTAPSNTAGVYKLFAKAHPINRWWSMNQFNIPERPVDTVPDFRLLGSTDASGFINLQAGYMRLQNGEILIPSGAAEASITGLFINPNTIMGGSPTANHIYYIYIDRYLLGDSKTLTDTGLKVRALADSTSNSGCAMFDGGLNSAPNGLYTPDKVNPYRYIPLGHIVPPAGSWNNVPVYSTAPISRDLMSGIFGIPQVATLNITSVLTTSFTHNLGGEPQSIYLSFYDQSANKKYALDVASYITDKNSSTVTFDLTGLTLAAPDNVELKCIFIPQTGDQIASISNRFESPWYTSGTGTQTVAHGLINVDDIRSYCVLEWDLTGGAPGIRRLLDPTTLVTSFDSTNFYLDWSALSPSGTMQYKVVSGGTPVPSALPTYLGGYTLFVGGAGGYPTLAAALAVAQAGDSILVTTPQLLSGAISTALNDIKITFMPNAYVTTPTYGLTFTGNNVSVTGLKMTVTGALTTAFSITSDDSYYDNIFINVTTGSVGTAFLVNAGGDRNWINATVKGTVTTKITNNGTDNDYSIRG